MGVSSLEKKDQVVALREKGYSLDEIVRETGIPKTSAYLIIKDIPLPKEEILVRKQLAQATSAFIKSERRRLKVPNLVSTVGDEKYSTDEIGRISMYAICFALSQRRIKFTIAGEGYCYDLLVDNGNKIIRVQIKSAIVASVGLPLCRLTNSSKEKYGDSVDVFGCFNRFSGTVYFFSRGDLISLRKEDNTSVALLDEWVDNFSVFNRV